ncbi:MAG TPA: serine/threonine-protein kinase [Gemmatimonadaceae bacterium]|nr:serine/threonine-protein kinase [Gemmatimonadaceae bacterium]
MTPERWRRVKAIVGEAMDTPTGERGPLLDRACGADAALRQEVESLLAAAADGADSFPEAHAAVAAEAAAFAQHDVPEGDATLRSLLEGALGQHYDVLRPLGRGSMGAVYLARERELDRFVAIKVLRPDLAAAPESRERFRREARIAAQLSHPGILPLHTFGEVGGVWYFVMGYVRGESLAERLRLEGRLPCDDARRILAELADALECAHQHGVVHRDIKPANILLDHDSGRAVLADFGISKIQGAGDSLTASGVAVGTPHYMSPEQALGSSDVDERSDLYSLGVVGYTIIAGREPFAGATAEELLYGRLTHDPAPLRSVVPSAPEDLAAVVMRCLERDRAMRWPDARSLREALAQAGCEPALALPEALRDLPGFGPYALAWALAWSALAALTLRSAGDRALLLLVALLVPVGLGLHLWNAGRHGLAPGRLACVAFWAPQWWGMWWPRALRRPGDLWARLPWQARLVRVALSLFFVVLPAMLLVRQWLTAEGVLPDDAGRRYGAAAELGIVLGAAAVTAGALRWALGRGLTLREAAHVLFGATIPSPAWRTPRVARLLAPASQGVRQPDRDAPADHVRAIAELVRLLPAQAADIGADAARTAHRLLAAIAESDREIAALARDASTSELDRLAAQLTVLGDAPPREDDDRRELRDLVRHQLELVRRMRGRQEIVSRRRAHLLDFLRGLWTQLCRVHDAAAGSPAAAGEPSGRVRALCAEIAEELQGRRSAAPTAAGTERRFGLAPPAGPAGGGAPRERANPA